ncbi:unnamed protein product [Acanthoscelides obtectus]|uniref:C2H2-type domain-containing protein n=1 Tax=Acanthoscelides obtectus TaxID=200917 RepID=A0A9P0P0Q4_ACAOB|nr:unnamed protein product [Acanthoscelides obtectus]CAK1669667.1 hypothetical protein AOBTE_LOCUS27148 [Acanthoscelides obtectus]
MTYKYHKNNDCTNEKKFKCLLCNFYNKRTYEIKKHYRSKHPEAETPRAGYYVKIVDTGTTGLLGSVNHKVICEGCNKQFKNHNSWRVHYHLDCMAPKKFGCAYCKFISTRKFSLKTHLTKKHQVDDADLKKLLQARN